MKPHPSKFRHFIDKMWDILATDFIYLLPAAIKWFYLRRIKKSITRHPIRLRNGKTASIYHHGGNESNDAEVEATLILHGLYSHPFIMRHLAEMAQEAGKGPVFSLYLSYDPVDHDINRAVIKKAIDTIERMMRENGSSLSGVVLVGHSMGAIEAAYRAYVDFDTRVISVISIAGRLKVVDTPRSPCGELLKPTVEQIYEGILSRPELPLFQIVGDKDWNATLESTLIRAQDECFHVAEEAMHFNILFHPDLKRVFPDFLRKSFRK